MKSLKLNITSKLNSTDKVKIESLSNEHRLLYNHLLGFIKQTKTSDFKIINEQYKNFRNEYSLTINSKSAQNTSITLINNIKSFYSLKKKDKTAKFPYKFKSWKFFTTFTYDWNLGHGGFKFKDNKLIIQKGILNISLNNSYFKTLNINNETVKTISFKKENNKYFIIFTYSEKPSNRVYNKDNFMSIDLGVSNIASCYSNVIKPLVIKNNRLSEKRIEKVQSLRDRYKRGSRKFKKLNKIFKKLKRKNVNKNKDFQHKVSKKIVDICKDKGIGTLVVGDIKTKKLTTSFKSKLNKSTQNNGYLSRFKGFLKYKSESLGIDFRLVNEAYTSQTNCLTGKRDLSSDLGNRYVDLGINLKVNRDINSAVNIAKKCKELGSNWLDHIEEQLKVTQEMFVDYHSKMQMIKYIN